MNTAEIVMSEMQSNCSRQMRQFFTIRICQAGQSSKLHFHCEGLPLNVASRDVLGIGVTLKTLSLRVCRNDLQTISAAF